MSDNRKKSRRRRSVDEAPALSTLEQAIAKHLRFRCPTKKGMLMGMQVAYFNGAKAVECLTESQWSSISTKALTSQTSTDSKHPVCFSSKHDAVQMLNKFLDGELFRRVVKVYKEDKSGAEGTSSNAAGDTSQSNTPRAVRQRKNRASANPPEPAAPATNDDESKEKEKAKKKKFKFELHDEQAFVNSPNEFYVWIYSPTTIKQYVMGALLVIGCIGVCLFPLWPAGVRTGVYYLSMALASLLGLLLSMAVFKYIIFAGVWLVTLGKIKFWLLPNLTEDVGFFESFVPLYTLNAPAATKKTTSKASESKKDQDNDDDDGEKSASKKEALDEDKAPEAEPTGVAQTESEHEDDEKGKSSSRSSSVTGSEDGSKPAKSSDEDFEVLSKDELETK